MDAELPNIEDLNKITPEQAVQYIKFVAQMRHNQKRWFTTHKPDALTISKKMEGELDNLNGRLLNPVPSLFG